jgi:cell division protein FtsI/penicillin-binding protein 2
LPFVSYGGSSLATSFISLLLLLLISSQAEEEPAALHHTHQPYVVVGTLLLGGLMAIGTLQVWWGYVRSGDLLARTDNPRRSIADQYVRRGSLLDRRNEPIVNTQGQPGSYERMTQYPALSAVTGYTHPFYGQAGLESTLDSYLRGMQGNPTSLIWSHHLLYGQPPPGLDVRLSSDLNVQRKADEVFQQEKGALVLLNAQTGEILAMVSNPSYNANTLDADWQTLMSNPDSPLINRATQGQYPLGTAFGPFLLATTLAKNQLPPLPETFNTSFQGQQWELSLIHI